MAKYLFLSLFAFSSFTAHGEDFPKLGNIRGYVIHNVNSSSVITFTDGSWNNCKQDPETKNSACDLDGALITVGTKKVELTEGHYFATTSNEDFIYYIVRGTINVGSSSDSSLVKNVSFKFIIDKKDGSKRGLLTVPDLAIREQIILD